MPQITITTPSVWQQISTGPCLVQLMTSSSLVTLAQSSDTPAAGAAEGTLSAYTQVMPFSRALPVWAMLAPGRMPAVLQINPQSVGVTTADLAAVQEAATQAGQDAAAAQDAADAAQTTATSAAQAVAQIRGKAAITTSRPLTAAECVARIFPANGVTVTIPAGVDPDLIAVSPAGGAWTLACASGVTIDGASDPITFDAADAPAVAVIGTPTANAHITLGA